MTIGRTVNELVHGANTYLPKKKKKLKYSDGVNARTDKVSSGLAAAGLTQAEINKLRGK